MGNSIGGVMRRPSFALLVVGQTLSQLGDKLHHMALIALVGATARGNTGGLELAKLSVVFTLPVVLFGPVAGALVDRWNKRLTMILCDALRAVIVFAIPALYVWAGHVWPVYVVAFFVFLAGTFFNAAKMSLIPDLVAQEQLLAANAALTGIGRVATLVGIVGGGVIIGLDVWRRLGWTDFAAGFYLDAASYVVSVLTLLGIVAKGSFVRRNTPVTHRSPLAWRDVRATLALVVRDARLRFAFSAVLVLAVIAASCYVILTASVQTLLGMGTRGVGYLGGLLAGGLIVGSLAVGTVGREWDKRVTIVASVAGVGTLLLLGSALFSFRAFAPIAVAGGALLGPIMVAIDTLLHEAAPAASRALVFSTRDLVLGAAFMLWSAAVGIGVWVAGQLGVAEPYRLVLAVAGVLIIAAGVAGIVRLSRSQVQPEQSAL